MKRKKKGGVEQNRIHVRQKEDAEILQFQKKEVRHDKRISVPVILLIVWIGLYFGSITFQITYYGIGTGGAHGLFWRPAAVMEHVSDVLQRSYALFILGENNTILAEYCMFLAIGLAGASLAACGAIFQGTFKNVLAGPSTMGVMSGGTLGAMLYLMAYYSGMIEPSDSLKHFCALAGCFGGVLLVILVATVAGKGKVSSTAMIIAGTVFSGVVSNILMIAQYYVIAQDPWTGANMLEEMRFLMMGSFLDVRDVRSVIVMGIPIAVCLILLMALRGRLNLLSFGEDEAASMGVNVKLYRNLMIVIGTVMTAMVVSFCGRIGFIGFMVPLLVRKLTGPDLRKLLPVSIAGGAVLLTVIYDVARLAGRTDSINMFTSLVGCTVLVVALLRKGGGRNAAEQGANAAGMGIR